MKKIKKGFTLVELVIVIAVIAILSAVLIPTFSGIIERAKESAKFQQAVSTRDELFGIEKVSTPKDLKNYLIEIDGTYFIVDNSGNVVNIGTDFEQIKSDTNIDYSIENSTTTNMATIYFPGATENEQTYVAGCYLNGVLKSTWNQLVKDYSVYIENGVVTNVDTSIKELKLPENVNISFGAIGNSQLEKLTITKNNKIVSHKYDYSDYYTASLKEINTIDSEYYFCDGYGLYDENGLVLFADNSDLTHYTVLTNVTINGENFEVTSIAENTFKLAQNLTSVTLGENITSLSYNSFREELYDRVDNVYYLGTETNDYFYAMKIIENSYTLQEGTKVLADDSVAGRTITLTIPASLERICENAFRIDLQNAILYKVNSIVLASGNTHFYCDGVCLYDDERLIIHVYNTGNLDLSSYNVTRIGNYACFGHRTQILTLPASVNRIGVSAFHNNGDLTQVNINMSTHKSLTIEDYAFYSTQFPHTITVTEDPDNVITVGKYAFWASQFSTSSNFLQYVTSVDEGGFSYSYIGKNIASVDMPKLTYIGNGAFEGCQKLQGITFGENPVLTYIGDGAFEGCNKITSFELPASVTHMGEKVFQNPVGGWYNLPEMYFTTFTVNENNTTYSSNNNALLSKDGTIFYELVKNKNVTSYTIPSGVKTIFDNAFNCCQDLQTITLNAELETIKSGAFNQTGITSITLTENVKTVEENALSYYSLTNIYVDSNNPYFSTDNSNKILYEGTSKILFILSGLTELTISNTITEIGYADFNLLTNITVEEGNVGGYSVDDGKVLYKETTLIGTTQNLEACTIRNNTTKIDRGCFGNTQITTITIPESVTIIEGETFMGLNNLTSIRFEHKNPGTISISDYSFGIWDGHWDDELNEWVNETVDTTIYCYYNNLNPVIDFDWESVSRNATIVEIVD